MKKEEIILMTKLAIYDKTYGEKDKKANDMFYRDYVYRRNFYLRFFALIGTLIPIGLSVIYEVFIEDVDFLNFDYMEFGINVALIIIGVQLFYTLAGTKIATMEYREIKTRLKGYFALMKELDELRSPSKNEDDEDYERATSYKEELRKKYGT